ncbi:MAG: FGGY family carbohydrate kinase [Propionicimonas sp.]
MTVIAGLDFGTSSVKLVVVTTDGVTLAGGQADYPTRTDLPGVAGSVEQHPEDWWAAARSVLAGSGVAGRVEVLAVTGQMQDLIAVADHCAVRPALLYSDTRATRQHRALRSRLPDWERRTGNHQDASNLAAKLSWLAEHEPATLAAAERLLFSAPGYIAWRAGGAAACDLTTASTTGLLDVIAQDWYADALALTGVDERLLPRLVGLTGADQVVGEVSPAAAAELGVSDGVPIVLAMGDAGATTDGLVGSQPGDAYLYLGTTGWLAAVTAEAPAEPSLIHSLVLPGWRHRLRIGAVQSAGSTAGWARERFLPGLGRDEAEALIADRVHRVEVRPLCLPGLAGERTPVRDETFRGAFVGVHEATTAADFYLAALTGVAFGLRHAADELGVVQSRIALVGGGSSSPAWRQILADVFAATIVCGDDDGPGCRSAALTAAQALGLPHTLTPLLSRSSTVSATEPSAAAPAYAVVRPTHRALYQALGDTFAGLAAAR